MCSTENVDFFILNFGIFVLSFHIFLFLSVSVSRDAEIGFIVCHVPRSHTNVRLCFQSEDDKMPNINTNQIFSSSSFVVRSSLAERNFHLSISLLLVARARASLHQVDEFDS